MPSKTEALRTACRPCQVASRGRQSRRRGGRGCYRTGSGVSLVALVWGIPVNLAQRTVGRCLAYQAGQDDERRR